MVWLDNSTLSFWLGGVARSYSLLEIGHRLEIYYVEDIDYPFLEAYLDNFILSELREFNYINF